MKNSIDIQTVNNLAEILLAHFERLNQPHIGSTDCSMSSSDIRKSDIWYLMWEALVQFDRMNKGQKPIDVSSLKTPSESDIGHNFIEQVLSHQKLSRYRNGNRPKRIEE